MKTAKEMFEELGYKLTLANNDTIIYRMKNDYEDRCVYFNIGNFLPQTYEVKFKIWFDNTDVLGWIPMNERRDDFDKHCAKYGHWMMEDAVIYPKLHKAINKMVSELGWLDKETSSKVKVKEFDLPSGKEYGVYCPKCNAGLSWTYKQKHCSKCGEKLDWSDIDDN